jgi:hypothetical protein
VGNTIIALAAAVAALFGAAAPSAHAARPLVTGFYDSTFAAEPSWLQRAVDIEGGMIRIHFEWSDVAPDQRAAGFEPADPASPEYRWTSIDRVVRETTAKGLGVLLSFDEAPTWAEGANRPGSAPPGSWKPDPKELERFGTALARRYSGRHPDAAGATLPRVRAFQVWNEQNLAHYLTPQWTRRRGGFAAFAPHHYRRMLNAFRTGAKAGDGAAVVVTGGTSPFGDPSAGEDRMQPARFLREMFCVNATLRRRVCADRVATDVVAHHPYSVGRPRRKALNPDDISIPDLVKIRRIMSAAKRLKTLGRTPRLWVTEVSYDSSPPDPDGIPVRRHARYAAETLYLLWKQGAEVVIWLTIRDELPNPEYNSSIQAGPYFNDGRPKPAASAFRFPFVTERTSRSSVRAWGRSPVAGTVVIERRVGNRWRRVTQVRAARRGTFLRQLRLRGKATLRARVGTATSLSWTQG